VPVLVVVEQGVEVRVFEVLVRLLQAPQGHLNVRDLRLCILCIVVLG